VLWTNSNTGQATLWLINPETGALTSWVWISAPAGISAGWQASSYAHVAGTTGYVLWTNGGTGQATLWLVDPETGDLSSWYWISAPAGLGSGWQASSYAHVDGTTGYVLWTNGGTGQATLWQIDPATGAMGSWRWITAPAGVEPGWLASSYLAGDGISTQGVGVLAGFERK
jgi:hypothetical protein